MQSPFGDDQRSRRPPGTRDFGGSVPVSCRKRIWWQGFGMGVLTVVALISTLYATLAGL